MSLLLIPGLVELITFATGCLELPQLHLLPETLSYFFYSAQADYIENKLPAQLASALAFAAVTIAAVPFLVFAPNHVAAPLSVPKAVDIQTFEGQTAHTGSTLPSALGLLYLCQSLASYFDLPPVSLFFSLLFDLVPPLSVLSYGLYPKCRHTQSSSMELNLF
ncbi:hypothetical protein ACLOJK_014731 [Asimina triloba]